VRAALGRVVGILVTKGDADHQLRARLQPQMRAHDVGIERQRPLRAASQPARGQCQQQGLHEAAQIRRLADAESLGQKDEGRVRRAKGVEVAQEGRGPPGPVVAGDPHRPVQRLGRADLPVAEDAAIGGVHRHVGVRRPALRLGDHRRPQRPQRRA